jgi:mRNA interferase MazF
MAAMKQGDIYLVSLEPTLHTEIGKTRPALILSIDEMNEHSPRVIVAPVTSNISKIYLHDVFVPKGEGGLIKDSKVMLDQLRSIDKLRLTERQACV